MLKIRQIFYTDAFSIICYGFRLVIVFFIFLLASTLFASVKDLSVDAKAIVLKNIAENDLYHSTFYNPSLNIFAKDNHIYSASYVPMEQDESIMQVLFSFPYLKGNAELNYSRFVSKGIEKWSDNNVFEGTSDYSQNLFGFLYSKKITDANFPFDFGVRLIFESADLGDEPIYSKKYLDIGVNKIFKKDLALGFSMLNLGDDENLKFAAGLNKKYYLDWYLSVLNGESEDLEVSISCEHKINDNMDVFAGLDNDIFDSYMDFLSGVKLGFGFDFDRIKLDYAFSKRGELGYVHYLTFGYVINKKKRDQKKQAKEQVSQVKEKYKIIVTENIDNINIRNYIVKYLEYNEDLDILDDLFYEKFDIYKSTDSLKVHWIITTEIMEVGDAMRLSINIFDIYENRIVKELSRDFYSDRNLEITVRNVIFAFLSDYKGVIEEGAGKREDKRVTKILKKRRRQELLRIKKLAKLEKKKNLEQKRRNRIIQYKKEQKLEKIDEFRKARLVRYKSEQKFVKLKRFEEKRQERLRRI